MKSGDVKLRPARQRLPRGRDRNPVDVEALRDSVGPPLQSRRERGVPAHETHDGNRVERPFCYRCHKAAVVCLCDRIRVVSNRTGIVIFQHPRERFHALGTARIANLSLSNCEIVVARGASRSLNHPVQTPPRTGVLYPGAGSIPLERAPSSEFPEHLVVLDGTWAHAHSLYRENAWLRALPHYELSPAEPSRYRLREEPKAECVSTIESIVCALGIIEPETEGLSNLLRVFDSMIDDQIRYML
jgi:DTW domain-containing protein YfiP